MTYEARVDDITSQKNVEVGRGWGSEAQETFPGCAPGVLPENYRFFQCSCYCSLFICTYTFVLKVISLNNPSGNVVNGLSKRVLKKNQRCLLINFIRKKGMLSLYVRI